MFLAHQSRSQEMYQQDFLVYHNMLMQPDTMIFAFWNDEDTFLRKELSSSMFQQLRSRLTP